MADRGNGQMALRSARYRDVGSAAAGSFVAEGDDFESGGGTHALVEVGELRRIDMGELGLPRGIPSQRRRGLAW